MSNFNNRANARADRLIEGANQLASFSENLSEEEWKKPVLGDGRSVGVVVHHVASVYPIEVELAQVISSGRPITEVTKAAVPNVLGQPTDPSVVLQHQVAESGRADEPASPRVLNQRIVFGTPTKRVVV